MKTVTVYVQLLDEGTPTYRPTEAIPMEGGFYKLLPTPRYDPEVETWEFLPNSVVRCVLMPLEGIGESVSNELVVLSLL